MTISFIIKKNKKRKSQLTTLISELKKSIPFTEKNFFFTEYPNHAFELAKIEALKKTTVVVAVGGDGTLNEVINGLLHKGYTETIFGYFPLGTANDFSKTAGLVNSINDFIEALNKINIKKINVGQVLCKNDIFETQKYFINIADTGLGGFIAKKLIADKKTFGGWFAYLKHTLLGFLFFKKKKVNIQLGNFSYNGKLLSVVVCNGKVFGNGLIVSPKALLSDGFFRITLFGDVSVWDYLKNLPKLKKGNEISHPNILYYKCKSVSISSQENSLETETDGEYAGQGDTTYKIAPFHINLLAINEINKC